MDKLDLAKAINDLDPQIHPALRELLISRASGCAKLPAIESITRVEKLEDVQCLPFLNEHGDLVIPSNSPSQYHWWNGGNSILEILQELKAEQGTLERYRNN